MKTRVLSSTLLLIMLIAPPARADDSEESTCSASDRSSGIRDVAVVARASCKGNDREDAVERSSDVGNSVWSEVSGATPPPTTKRTTLVNGCLESLAGEPGLDSCLQQEEAFCPGQESTWVVPETTDTAAPEQPPTYGMRQCTQSGAGPDPGTDGQEARPAVSIDDVAELFAPQPQILSDDEGRGVRNAETNFYTDGEVRTLRTTMNGEDVELRLTPIQYIWDYGDGSAPHVTSVSGGAQPGFDVPTATSHVYEETGAYPVTLTTVYVGEVRYEGEDWERIDGQITRTAAPETADIWTTSTRNVAEDCAADPGAWGCTGPVDAPDGG